jgi:hypothetical protein
MRDSRLRSSIRSGIIRKFGVKTLDKRCFGERFPKMKSAYQIASIFLFFLASSGMAADKFRIGADNSDQSIKNLTELTGLRISQIEDRARPCRYSSWSECSSAGFLGKNESFISRLLVDNQFVHWKKLTHGKLASFLFTIMQMPSPICTRNDPKSVWSGGECVFNGIRSQVSFFLTAGWQKSLFDDKLIGSFSIVVQNLKTNQKEEFADLLPSYIQRYGFYEGDTPYRLSPSAIIKMFEIESER